MWSNAYQVDFFSDKKQVSSSDGTVATDDWNKDGRRFKQLWSIENIQIDRFFVASVFHSNIKMIVLNYL